MRFVIVTIILLLTGVAHAQPSAEDRMMAQALFEDGIKLIDAGRFDEACPKFEESDRLDPGIGVRFRLADCYEQAHRFARAWILFVDVSADARSAGQHQRSAAAKRRAAAIEPRLSRLRIDVIEPIAELVVSRNGVPINRAQWGTAAVVEPGDHVIEAHAQGYRSWREVVNVVGEGVLESVVVPPLNELPPVIDPEPDPIVHPRKGGNDGVRRGFGIGLGALGLIGIGVGTVAGILAIDKKNQADAFCPAEDACFQQGLTLRDEASDIAAVSTVGFVVGIPAVVGGLILWLTADEDEPQQTGVAPIVLPGGLGLVGTF